MFGLVETANELNLFKEEKIVSKYKFDDIYHAEKVYNEMNRGLFPEEIVDFLVDNGVEEIIVDRSLLKANKQKQLENIKFIEDFGKLRCLKEKVKMQFSKTRGLSHAMAHKNVNFYTLDPLIVQSFALFKQVELDMEKYDKRAVEIYLNYLPELKIKKRLSDSADETVEYKEKFNIEVIQRLWKIRESENIDQKLQWVRTSVGMNLSEDDWKNLERIIDLFNLKKENMQSLEIYLKQKLVEHAPNLTALLGFRMTSEMISLSGSLVNLAKSPAGTVQVLGAEKALFRSLKSKTPTPKYGILKNNDLTTSPRIIRALANKIVICARIDAFSKNKTSAYGEALKEAILLKVNQNVQIDTNEILKTVSEKLKKMEKKDKKNKITAVDEDKTKKSDEKKKRKISDAPKKINKNSVEIESNSNLESTKEKRKRKQK